jgi:hypothetical protein
MQVARARIGSSPWAELKRGLSCGVVCVRACVCMRACVTGQSTRAFAEDSCCPPPPHPPKKRNAACPVCLHPPALPHTYTRAAVGAQSMGWWCRACQRPPRHTQQTGWAAVSAWIAHTADAGEGPPRAPPPHAWRSHCAPSTNEHSAGTMILAGGTWGGGRAGGGGAGDLANKGGGAWPLPDTLCGPPTHMSRRGSGATPPSHLVIVAFTVLPAVQCREPVAQGTVGLAISHDSAGRQRRWSQMNTHTHDAWRLR